MLIKIGHVYVEPSEIVAIFTEPEVEDSCTLMLSNGHLIDVDVNKYHVMRRLRSALKGQAMVRAAEAFK